ncbi:MAG: TetR/AcrR family transcriptional regulator [Selenomonas sp.]|uniref:TetR/AcrR family transcriptional regulator n=1 Tax=Selenomonas sp. TaxID=2053611 RepID=UPI0025F33D25|nr:TetR/AcrR family transcriptional regulator [Selenomonas sp.]MCR5756650.1 TetR/AcrR family transcriptional regulator [Selenomonas sp.]
MEEKMGRRERKKMLSRQAILDAAVVVFSKKGFREASIADIMNGADLGTGTFYNYFQSKEELLVQLLGRLVKEVNTQVRDLQAEERPSCEILYKACMLMAKFLDENRYVMPLFLAAADHSGVPENVAEHKTVPTPGFKPLFEKILKEGQDKGEVRKDVPAELITEMFHSIYQATAFSKLEISFQENVAMKMKLLLDGIKA